MPASIVDAHARGMVLHFLQVGRIEALVIAEAGKLDGIELQTRRVIQQLDSFPLERADRVGIEAQLDGNGFRGGTHGSHRRRGGCLQKRAPTHRRLLYHGLENEMPAKLTTLCGSMFHCS